MRVVCIGDSITFGQHIHRDLAWTSLLQEWNPELEIINRGICGDTTRTGLERFPRDVQEFDPEIVILQFGFNDCNRWDTDRGLPRVSKLAFQANLSEMVARARNFGAREVILLSLHKTLRPMAYESGCAAYSKSIRFVAQMMGATFVDIRKVFYSYTFAGLDDLLLDGLHLSEEGNRVYAKALQPALHIATHEMAMVA